MKKAQKKLWLVTLCFASLMQLGCVSNYAPSSAPKESDITRGLSLVSDKQYAQAITPLESGLKWLKRDPSYVASNDPLISQEAEYISKLIEQLRDAERKGLFRSSAPMARVILQAIEAQANIIETIDDRRRSQATSMASRVDVASSFQEIPERSQEPEKKSLSVVDSPSALALKKGRATVGVQECKMFVTEDLEEEVISLEAGSQVEVTKIKAGLVQAVLAGGKTGWIRQCYLASSEEYTRRKKNNEIPVMVTGVGAEKDGRIFLYGPMEIMNNKIVVMAGQAFWMDSSAKGKTFHVASHKLLGNPRILFLYKEDGSIARLPIWQNPQQK